MKRKVILKNADIITMDEKGTHADSLSIENGKITALGSFSDFSGLIESGVEVLDLGGMAIVPGFTDCHVHLIMTGISHQQLQLKDARSFDEIFDKIRLWDKEHPGNDWICGWFVNDTKLKEGRMPEAKDLDRADVDRPVWILRADGNTSSVNTQGLQKVIFSIDDFSVIKNGSGKPTGMFKVPSNFAIRFQILNSVGPEIKKKSVEWAAAFAVSRGVTTVHAMEYLEDIPIIQGIINRLPIKVEIYARSDDPDRILQLGLKTIGGDVLLDGTFPSSTAAISAPYADNKKESGILYYEKRKDHLLEVMKRARLEGLQSAFHAIGDRGIGMALEIFEEVFGKSPETPIRHRIEHYVLPDSEQIRKTQRLGVYASMAPAAMINCLEEGTYFKRLGPGRVRSTFPLREIFDRGVVVGGNSDSPVLEMNPLAGIHTAVNAPYEPQRVKLNEAIKMFTINGARLGLKEEERGSIDVGKSADLVVLKRNPFSFSQDKIKDIEVMMTFVDGQIKYNKNR
jgi:hypothetical protein